jgi:DNA-binding MarR family transcriptional regulator/GNAT superfamily N-acetyltransferase
MDHEVAVLRRFNRAYTQRIGVLEESYLGVGRPLGPSRVLFELGRAPLAVVDLRRRLGLDSGYLSRMLRELERDGLVAVERDPADGRRRLARLTRAGTREWTRLDRRSDEVASTLLAPLTERQRSALADGLRAAELLLRVATVTFEVVDPCSPDAQAAMRVYFAELDARFRGGFDPGAGGTGQDAESMSPPHGAFVLARSDGDVVGCGGVLRIDARTGEIKRMWIHADLRGAGLGRRLLTELEATAFRLGRSRVVLDTNEVLTEAVAMYGRSGYRAIERYNDNPYAHHWFEKRLTRGAGSVSAGW